MLEYILDTWYSIKESVSSFFTSLEGQRKTGVFGGIMMLGAAAFAGGRMLQYAVGGIIVNSMFWLLIKDSETVMNFMRYYGSALDITLTIGSFFGGGGTVAGWLISLMGTGFFTFFRMTICKPLTEEEKHNVWYRRLGRWIKSKLPFVGQKELAYA